MMMLFLYFLFRDELESVRKEFIQQGDEVKYKLDKSEENVCFIFNNRLD